MNIINKPTLRMDYEFTAVRKLDEDLYEYIGSYTDAGEAYKIAQLEKGVVIHNIRVSHWEERS